MKQRNKKEKKKKQGRSPIPKGEGKLIAQNRKARHDYSIIGTVEVGLVLQGAEIKSIRNGRINLEDSFARIQNGGAFLCNVHISPYEQGNIFSRDPLRTGKLLLHKKQINKLIGGTENMGIILVPLKVYIRDGYTKVLIGLAKGEKQYDRREGLKRREVDRQINRTLKNNRR